MSALPLVSDSAPRIELTHLDDLWFQVGGTLCNLECRHCFISCSPHNHRFGFMDLATVRRLLDESVQLGVKEHYFTGGEPFLNCDMVAILELTLQYGPATVLTNATVFKDDWLVRLSRAEAASLYSLEFRVSLDGFTAKENDSVRGPGTFERALKGIRQLLAHGFLPIITVARTRDDADVTLLAAGFMKLLRSVGYDRPRLKILPTLRIGAEVQRQRGYHEHERVTREMMHEYDPTLLICSHSRCATDRGVYVCPILIDSDEARIASALADSLSSYPLRLQACFTCYQYGALCANPSSKSLES